METIVESKCPTCQGRLSKYHMDFQGTDVYVNLCWKDSTFDVDPEDHPMCMALQLNPNIMMELIHLKKLKIRT